MTRPVDPRTLVSAADQHMAAIEFMTDELRHAEARIAGLERDLATFTAEPGILARVESDHVAYWYNQTRMMDDRAEGLRAALDALLDAAHGVLFSHQSTHPTSRLGDAYLAGIEALGPALAARPAAPPAEDAAR